MLETAFTPVIVFVTSFCFTSFVLWLLNRNDEQGK
jgi:hypothetical protein